MKILIKTITIFFLSLGILSDYGITCATETNNHSSPIDTKRKPSKSIENKRKYKFPSIMVKHDMHHCNKDGDYNCTPLLGNLVVNSWDIIHDKYGRQCKYSSPAITYAELKEYLHFNDDEVIYLENPKPGAPQAVIRTEWLTCNITFLNQVYDRQDASVKLTAVLIDNEVMANSLKDEEYRKKKGIIRTLLDFFDVVHQ